MKFELPSHDTLSILAEEHPERLETLRQEWINNIIESAPNHLQRRLRGLQFQIDSQRHLHSTPLAACIEISRMMHDSLDKLNQLLNHRAEQPQEHEQQKATVISFPCAAEAL